MKEKQQPQRIDRFDWKPGEAQSREPTPEEKKKIEELRKKEQEYGR